jgi:hypothetical protein
MIKQLASVALLLAMALGAAIPASAGTYVSGALPPEFGGGFLPPDPAVLKNLQNASKANAKLGASIEKCYAKGIQNVSKGRDSNLAECLFDERTGVLIRHVAKIAKIAAKPPGLPPCFDFEVLGTVAYDYFTSTTATQYCEE